MSLSLFNLNIMHGRNRKRAAFPLWVRREEAERNLHKIIDCIRKHNPDIVTLQEVDQPSVLSGNFNQVDFLNAKLEYPYTYFAPSFSLILFGKSIFVSGTAIFSRYPLENCEAFNFNFSFPTERKGFIIADAKLPNGKILTIASAHLVYIDWVRLHSRAHQLQLVEKVVAAKKNSVVLAGDFNCGLLDKEESLRTFVHKLNLKAYDPENKNLNTHQSWDPRTRIDWVLTSKDIHFVSYKTVPERLSDHLAVFVELSILG